MKNDMIKPKGNKMNRSGIHRWMVVLMVALFALPVMAGWITQGNDSHVISSAYAFQSTSTMQGSGSAHSSTPASLNEDGQATYSSPSVNSPAYAPNGPRRSFGENSEGGTTSDPSSPIGDAVLPLLLMAAAAAGVIAWRRKRLQNASR